jgi:apolipoprotein N-acyltransferase
MSISSVRKWLRQLSGWKRLGVSFSFGSAMALAMPPFNVFPLVWICFPAVITLLQGATKARQAFGIGWSFAFGFLVFGLYWIAASMFVDIKTFWWAVPFAVAGLPALLAIYYGLAAVLARKIGLQGVKGAITFGLLWFLAEYARGHLFTGFPWIILGYTWSGILPVLQVTSLIGIYGLTLLTAVAASLPAAVEGTSKPDRAAFAASLGLFLVFAAWGGARLHATEITSVPDVYIRLVQPNTEQARKWAWDEREKNFQQLIDMTALKSDKPITHVFWPETASTYYLSEDPFRRNQVASVIPAATSILTGVVRRTEDEKGNIHFYNSLVALDGLSRLVAGYDKGHLVPFGEYMPYRKYIPLKTIVQNTADFSAGPGPRSLRVIGLPLFSPLICYEVIFPGRVVDPNDRPDFLVNLTNDGWYGKTTGPYQHFDIARVRAIEEGMPLVRVANTGISGVVDPLGRVKKKLDLGIEGVIDSDLPTALPPTPYGKWREIPLWLAFSFFFINAFSLKNLRSKRS